EEDAEVLLRPHVPEGDVRFDRVALPLLGDGPAGLHLVQDHLVAPLLRRRHHRREAVLLQPVIRLEGVHRLPAVPADEEHFVHRPGASGEMPGGLVFKRKTRLLSYRLAALAGSAWGECQWRRTAKVIPQW